MKRISLFSLMLLALCSLLLHSVHAESKANATPPDKGRQAWFLDMLKTLADTEDLTDPAKVGAILGVTFNKSVVTTGPSHMESFAKSFERDEYTSEGKTWFEAGEPGYASTGNWKPNGGNGFVAGVDPHAKGTKVNVKYFESKRFGLPDDDLILYAHVAKNDTQTTVIFYGIDKLTCITLQDIQSFFPGIHHMGGTDASSERYFYYPPVREEAGNVLSFEAPAGKCVTEATVHEFSGFGKRIKRAQRKLDQCLRDAGPAFCKKYPDARPQSDFPTFQKLKVFLHDACGGLDAFYQKEPLTGEEPKGDEDFMVVHPSCP